MKHLFKPHFSRVLKRTANGWLVSKPGSEYFFLIAPLGVLFAIVPWILLVNFAASFWVGVVGILPAGMISYDYVKLAISFFRLKRVTVNKSYLLVSRFGKTTKYPVESIESIKSKEMRFVSVRFTDGVSVYFMGMPGYNIFDDKTSFERILEVYES